MGGYILGFQPVSKLVWRAAALLLAVFALGCSASVPEEQASSRDLHMQLDSLSTPDGADPAQFTQLKQALAAMLDSGAVRTVSAPPTKPNAMVTNFDVVFGVDQTHFTWTYTNPGDYNQDGEVNISDLSILGRYLGRTPNSPDWDEAIAADGNHDGEVNISDLSVLGGNLLSRVEGYKVRSTETPGDSSSWQVVANVTLQDALPGPDGTLVFNVQVPTGNISRSAYFQAVPYDGSQLGIASNSDTLIALPPVIAGVSPIAGQSGDAVTFSASVFGAQPLSYDWDFGGTGDPTDSQEATPTIVLGPAGTYTAFLSVANQAGQDTFQFTVTVTDNQPPQVSLSASPNAGSAPLSTTLAAAASDPDGIVVKYEWDLDGDGKYETNTGALATTNTTFTTTGAHLVRVRVTDDSGATATDSTEVNVAALPSAVVSANVTQVIAPEYVTLDASGSSSPNGAIVKYQWDWDGNGTIDADTKTDPFYRAYFDALPGTYKAKVIVTDVTGAQNSATVTVAVTGTKFVAPPVEGYQDLSSRGDSLITKWLKNSYSTLPEWNDANGPYQNAYFAQWADEIFTRINAERTRAGLAPCTRLRPLDLLSQAHERDQALRSYFSHDTPEGITYGDRLLALNPPALDHWGEIIAQGQESPEETVQQWMASPGHHDIIMTPSLKWCGVGMYWKTNGTKGLESYWGVAFAGFKGGAAPPAGWDWLLPEDVL